MNRLLNRANRRVSLGGAATLLLVVALISQALGFLRTRLLSTNFTVQDPGLTDAFYVAFVIPDFFYYTIAAGALGVAFMPVIADKLAIGDKKAISEITSSLINVISIAMGVVAIIILLFANPLIHLLAPDLPSVHQEQAITIMRLLAFNPLMFSLFGILSSVQQSYGRFFFYAISSLFYNVAIITSIFLFRDNIGIIGVGVGAVVGAFLQTLVAGLGLIGINFRWRPTILWRREDVRSVLRQVPPRSLDQGIDQVNSVVELNRAQALGVGPVTYYTFALTLHNVPVIMLGNSIATAAFPRLTDRLSQKRPDLFRRDFLRILRVMIWISVPIIVIAYFARGYLARLIFGDAAPQVAIIFGFFAVAIFFRIVYAMVSRYFYAHKDTKTPLFVSIFAIALNIFLAFQLAKPDAYGAAGLALAQSMVAASEVAILVAIMVHRDHKLIDKDFLSGISRIASVTGFTLLVGYIMIKLLPLQRADRGFITLGSKLAIITIVTLSVHLLVSWLFEMEEAKAIVKKTRQIALRPVRID